MMKKWISLLLVALMLLAIAPVAMADPEVTITEDSIVTIVNCKNSANVREKATSNSAKIGEAKRGKTFQLLAVEGNWYKIQYTKEKTGYVFHTFVKVGKKGDAPLANTATVTNAPNGVNIRTKASSKSKILGVAHNGDTFDVKGKSGKWTKVAYSTGVDGVAYIFTSYLTINGGGSSSDVTPVDNEKGYIDCNTKVNVRKKASSSSTKLGTLERGTEITITGISGKWTRISYKGDSAFVFSEYVSSTKPDSDVTGKTATIVNCKYAVNIRKKASSSSTKLGTAKNGETFEVKGVSGKWVKIAYDGGTAYVYNKYVKIG